MCKVFLRNEQRASDIEMAARWSRELTRIHTRGPGDLENAMYRVEAEYGIPYATLWALRYRKPKKIDTETFSRLGHAYDYARLNHVGECPSLVEEPPLSPHVAEWCIAAIEELERQGYVGPTNADAE